MDERLEKNHTILTRLNFMESFPSVILQHIFKQKTQFLLNKQICSRQRKLFLCQSLNNFFRGGQKIELCVVFVFIFKVYSILFAIQCNTSILVSQCHAFDNYFDHHQQFISEYLSFSQSVKFSKCMFPLVIKEES